MKLSIHRTLYFSSVPEHGRLGLKSTKRSSIGIAGSFSSIELREVTYFAYFRKKLILLRRNDTKIRSDDFYENPNFRKFSRKSFRSTTPLYSNVNVWRLESDIGPQALSHIYLLHQLTLQSLSSRGARKLKQKEVK